MQLSNIQICLEWVKSAFLSNYNVIYQTFDLAVPKVTLSLSLSLPKSFKYPHVN